MPEASLKDISLIVALIAGFVFLISFAILYIQSGVQPHTYCACRDIISLIVIVVASAGLFVGALVYFILMDKIVKKYRHKKQVLRAVNPFLSVLSKEEKTVMEKIIQAKKIRQTDLVKETGISRVQCTRVLQKLEEKGLIERKKNGKINTVVLHKDLRLLFS